MYTKMSLRYYRKLRKSCTIAELREYVGYRGCELAAEHVDAGVSCAKASRPAFERLNGGRRAP